MALTRREAAIIGAYTGVNMKDFGDIVAYAEELTGESLSTIAFALPSFQDRLAELAKPDFLAICDAITD